MLFHSIFNQKKNFMAPLFLKNNENFIKLVSKILKTILIPLLIKYFTISKRLKLIIFYNAFLWLTYIVLILILFLINNLIILKYPFVITIDNTLSLSLFMSFLLIPSSITYFIIL